jgi:hypothetical protein
MQLGAEINKFSLIMVAPHACFPSNIKDTTEGYLPWGALVPFTMRCSPIVFSNRRGTAERFLVIVVDMNFYFLTQSGRGESQDADGSNHDCK